jgi:pyrroloquinoline quinone (PQQ) biosynthesis protein C
MTRVDNLVRAAVSPEGAPFAEVEAAARAIAELAEAAYGGGSRTAFAEYQNAMYDLAFPVGDLAGETTRRWLAQFGYRVEERYVSRVDDFDALSDGAFAERIDAEIKRQSRTNHPLSQFIYSGEASRAQLRAFVHHQWFRTFKLYRDAAELALNLPNLDDAAFLYRYLYGETGGEEIAEAHSHLLGRLVKVMGLEPDFDLRPTMLEEVVYLNNRARCYRHTDVAWGLAIFYVTELVVPANHERLYQAFKSFGLSDEENAYYKIHITMVPPRVKREWKLIGDRLGNAAFQKTFLTSLRHTLTIEHAYYDAVWAEIRALGP